MLGVFRSGDNWRNALNIFRYITNPLAYLSYLVFPAGNPVVRVNTPTGIVSLRLRNRESAKTVFSIFCRHDYLLPENEAFFLDLGSNIGIAAAYFLSRNTQNRIICVEPDPNNIPFLKENMRQFDGRFEHKPVAVHTDVGSIDFYCSTDGKYSTTVLQKAQSDWDHINVPCVPFTQLCEESINAAGPLPVIVKIDVEGLESELIASVDFNRFPAITRMIIESTECSELVTRKHSRNVRNGYIEDLVFD